MISSLGEAGLLTRLMNDGRSLRLQVDTLAQQATTGRRSETYAGLGASARTPLSLRPQIASGEQWQRNIDGAQGRFGASQAALTSISGIAADFLARTTLLNDVDPGQVDLVAGAARAALRQVAGLLNTQVGDAYVFTGQDSANPPVPNADAILGSSLFLDTQAAVAGLAANGAAATIAATRGVATGASPFSPSAGSPGSRPTIEIGPGRHVEVGLLADRNTLAVSAGGSTTGSYMRDVMRALATLGSLGSGQTGTPGFAALVADMREGLRGAVSAMGAERGALGDVQRSLDERKVGIGDQALALRQQLDSVENVDLAETLSRLAQTRTRLEASYQIIAGLRNMSLTNYL